MQGDRKSPAGGVASASAPLAGPAGGPTGGNAKSGSASGAEERTANGVSAATARDTPAAARISGIDTAQSQPIAASARRTASASKAPARQNTSQSQSQSSDTPSQKSNTGGAAVVGRNGTPTPRNPASRSRASSGSGAPAAKSASNAGSPAASASVNTNSQGSHSRDRSGAEHRKQQASQQFIFQVSLPGVKARAKLPPGVGTVTPPQPTVALPPRSPSAASVESGRETGGSQRSGQGNGNPGRASSVASAAKDAGRAVQQPGQRQGQVSGAVGARSSHTTAHPSAVSRTAHAAKQGSASSHTNTSVPIEESTTPPASPPPKWSAESLARGAGVSSRAEKASDAVILRRANAGTPSGSSAAGAAAERQAPSQVQMPAQSPRAVSQATRPQDSQPSRSSTKQAPNGRRGSAVATVTVSHQSGYDHIHSPRHAGMEAYHQNSRSPTDSRHAGPLHSPHHAPHVPHSSHSYGGPPSDIRYGPGMDQVYPPQHPYADRPPRVDERAGKSRVPGYSADPTRPDKPSTRPAYEDAYRAGPRSARIQYRTDAPFGSSMGDGPAAKRSKYGPTPDVTSSSHNYGPGSSSRSSAQPERSPRSSTGQGAPPETISARGLQSAGDRARQRAQQNLAAIQSWQQAPHTLGSMDHSRAVATTIGTPVPSMAAQAAQIRSFSHGMNRRESQGGQYQPAPAPIAVNVHYGHSAHSGRRSGHTGLASGQSQSRSDRDRDRDTDPGSARQRNREREVERARAVDEMIRTADAGMAAFASKGTSVSTARAPAVSTAVQGATPVPAPVPRTAAAPAAAPAGGAADLQESTAGPSEVAEVPARPKARGVNAAGKAVKLSRGLIDKVAEPVTITKRRGKKAQDSTNQDHCSSCRGIGNFLCCDGCPRSFHFMCVDPPLRPDEAPVEELWFCKPCRAARAEAESVETPTTAGSMTMRSAPKPPLRPIPQTFKMLCHRLGTENPTTFRLPEEIVTFFANVAEDFDGDYMDEAGHKIRKGAHEDKHGYRFGVGKALATCYACEGSVLPNRHVTTDPGAPWRPLASCGYCALYWHLDCLSPPLAKLPTGKRWMCPNHAEQVMPRKRTVREGVEVVQVQKAGRRNNGHVEVLDGDASDRDEDEDGDDDEGGEEERVEIGDDGEADEMMIRRKYQIPEKVIQMDFVRKVRAAGGKGKDVEGPVVQLSDLTLDDIDAASLILGLGSTARPISNSLSTSSHLPAANQAGFASGSASSAVQRQPTSVPPNDDDHDMNVDGPIPSPERSAADGSAAPAVPAVSRMSHGPSQGPAPKQPAVATAADPALSTPTPAPSEGVVRAVGKVDGWRPQAGGGESKSTATSGTASPRVTTPTSATLGKVQSLQQVQTDSYSPVSSYRLPPARVSTPTAAAEPGASTGGDVDMDNGNA